MWTAQPDTLASLQFEGSFPDGQPGLQVTTQGKDTLVVSADLNAEPGSSARLLVSVAGTLATPAEMTVRVAAAAPPTVSDMSLVGVRTGTTGTINIRGYLTSPLSSPDFAIVGPLEPLSGSPATVTQDGPTTISVTPGPQRAGPAAISRHRHRFGRLQPGRTHRQRHSQRPGRGGARAPGPRPKRGPR